jgi:glutamate-1-semialdehyde 2,1-aminomutase
VPSDWREGLQGREKIIKFSGCYHGHSDAFLIQAGSGAVTFGSPNSPGVTKGTAQDTLLAAYNNVAQLEEIFKANPEQIAAVILRPVAGNMGCVPPQAGFMESVRHLCNQHGALLVFDEVMTGFRLAKGGAQELLGVDADIVAYGKVIGGGLPCRAPLLPDPKSWRSWHPKGPSIRQAPLAVTPWPWRQDLRC